MTRRRTRPKTRNNKKTARAKSLRMARSSGEQPRDVKRRYARRGGSIPPRAEQQEKSIFCTSTSPPLETVSPTRKEDAGQANSHTLAARKDEQKTNNNRLKRFGQRTFFLTAGKTANKRRFTNGLAAGAKRRHSWQAWEASRGCNTPLFVKVSSFPSLLMQIDAKHLAHAPGSNPGLATILHSERRTSCSIT